MQKPKMFFLAETLDFEKSSLAFETIRQASLFAARGFETTLISFDFDAFYPFLRSRIYSEATLDKHALVRNMHEDLAGYSRPSLVKKEMPVFDVAIFEEQGHVEKRSDHIYEVMNGGRPVKRVILSRTGTLAEIQYMDDTYRNYREDYNPWGKLKRKTYTGTDMDEVRQEIYYNKKGKAYMSIWYDREHGDFDKAHLLNDKGMIVREFSEAVQLKAHWLNSLLEEAARPVVISNSRGTDRILRKVKADEVSKIMRLNNTPRTVDGADSPAEYGFTEKIFSEFDGFFLHSEREKIELGRRFGNEDKMYVIPYCPEQNNRRFRLFKRKRKDRRLAVALVRDGRRADYDQVMRAFRIVNRENPDVFLHVYGQECAEEWFRGMQREYSLQNVTRFSKLGIKEARLCEPALFSIVISNGGKGAYPAMESMSAETPVIGIGRKHCGVIANLIENGITGYIVNEGDSEALANKMLHMFSNPAECITMGEQANRHIRRHYNEETCARKWEEFIDDITGNN